MENRGFKDIESMLGRALLKALEEDKPLLQAFMEDNNTSPNQMAETVGMTVGDLEKGLEYSRKHHGPSMRIIAKAIGLKQPTTENNESQNQPGELLNIDKQDNRQTK